MAVYYLRNKKCVAGCPSSDDHKLFTFPRSESRYQQWSEVAQIPFVPGSKLKGQYLCARHFDSRQFRDKYRYLLIRYATPSITKEQYENSIRSASLQLVDEAAATTSSSMRGPFPDDLAAAGLSGDQIHGLDIDASSLSIKDTLFTDLFPLSFFTAESEDATGGMSRWGAERSPEEFTLGAPSSNDPPLAASPLRNEVEDIVSVEVTPDIIPQTSRMSKMECTNGEAVLALPDTRNEERFRYSICPLDPYYRYNLCRLCFRVCKRLVNIFEGQQLYGFTIKDGIEDLLQFQVSKADDYPQHACIECINKLCDFKKFKDQFVKDRGIFEEALMRLRCCSFKAASEKIPACASSKSCNEYLSEKVSVECEGEADPPSRLIGVALEFDSVPLPSESVSGLRSQEDSCGRRGEDVPSSESGSEDWRPWGKEGRDADPVDFVELKLMDAEGEVKCRECGEVFQYLNQLKEHVWESHESQRPIPCIYCRRRFRNMGELNAHVIVHSDYKPFECEHCSLRCRSKPMLMRHKLTHSDVKPFLCSQCGRTFCDQLSLRRHILRNHALRGRKRFGCTTCGKEFALGYKLQDHVRTVHTKECPFKCRDCGKAFPSGRSRKRHMVRDHSAAPKKWFLCSLCSKRFSSESMILRHMERIHKASVARVDSRA